MTARIRRDRSAAVTDLWQAAPDLADEPDAAAAVFQSIAFIRRFEELTHSLFLRGAIFGSTHLGIGQEAVSVGVCSFVQPGDRVTATYRGHAVSLALGIPPVRLLAEMMGKEAGISSGRSGSMNVISHDHGLIGCFGIVGGSLAAATGVGFSLQRQDQARVAIAFFGDGAANQGYFQECLNLAALQRLPVVYVCENNQYMEFTPTTNATAGGILPRVTALGIHAEEVDGQDVATVRAAAAAALERARSGGGPQFIEAQTYRYSDHARGDPINYRPDGEMEAWKARDPLIIAAHRLVDEFGWAETEIAEVLAEVQEQVTAVRNEARAAADANPADLGSQFKDPMTVGVNAGD
jgi:TPP-dependent pyruvate/acetoin dehydrogenase alpha subunit